MPIVRFFQLKLRYEYSTTLILHENELFDLSKFFGSITANNFI
jgi:hypothetical protein